MRPHRIGLRPPATWRAFEHDVMRPAIGIGCAYEAVAIGTNRVPTISELVHRLYSTPQGRALLWVLYGWLTTHLFERVLEQAVEEAVEEATA